MKSKNRWLSFPDSCHHFDVDLFLELLLLLIDTFFVIEHLKKNLINDCRFVFPSHFLDHTLYSLYHSGSFKWFLCFFSKVCFDFREIFLELSICWGRFVSCFIANTLSPAFSIGKQQKKITAQPLELRTNYFVAQGINRSKCCTNYPKKPPDKCGPHANKPTPI